MQMIHQKVLGVVVDVIPGRRADARVRRRRGLATRGFAHRSAAAAAEVDLGAKRVAGAGDDNAAVSVVARDFVKGVRQLLVRRTAPLERAALAMQRHLDNAVAALHGDVLVLALVFLELAHFFFSPGRADTNRWAESY